MTATYTGSTGGSTTANPPIHIAGAVTSVPNSPGVTGGRLWFYTSTNTAPDMYAASVITDGAALGLKQGDVVLGVYATAGSTAAHIYLAPVAAVVASSAATLSTNFISSTMA